jgi:cell division septation protein DedD
MVFPPLNQNANPPSPASVSPNGPPPANTANGTMPNNQPRAIKTFTVRGDQPDASGTPAASASQQSAAAKPAAAARALRTPAAAANANASANAPMSLSPQAGAQPAPATAAPTRVATNAPAPIAPAAASSGGGYLVQVSSQKNEADAQSSYRVLQGKYPSVLGSQSVLVKRVDLGEKGIYYRAFAGPFSSVDQATQVCSSLKAAGGPRCIIQRN